MKRRCCTCKVEKELDVYFSRNKNLLYGRKYVCKACCSLDGKRRKKPPTPINIIDGEIWKDIHGFVGKYQVSNLGRVKALPKTYYSERLHCDVSHPERLLSQIKRKKEANYVVVTLTMDGKDKMLFIHRLVAGAFLDNPNNYPFVNHKNSIQNDNRSENLEWVSQSENVTYGFVSGRRKVKTSKYTGVCWNKEQGKWTCAIHISELKKQKHLGSFVSEEDARDAYKKAFDERNMANKYLMV